MTSYTFRDSIFDTATAHLIRGDELILRRGDGFEEFIRLAEVRSVRLRTRSTRQGDWHECIVRTAHRRVRIRSRHRIGFRRFESRLAEYQQFLQALHAALLPRAAHVRFARDSRPASLAAMIPLAGRLCAAAYDPSGMTGFCMA